MLDSSFTYPKTLYNIIIISKIVQHSHKIIILLFCISSFVDGDDICRNISLHHINSCNNIFMECYTSKSYHLLYIQYKNAHDVKCCTFDLVTDT